MGYLPLNVQAEAELSRYLREATTSERVPLHHLHVPCSDSPILRGNKTLKGGFDLGCVLRMCPRLSGPVLRDTARLSQRYPPIARYGVFGVSRWQIGCDTPSPFSECIPPGEHAKWRCDTPPQKGYLSDIGAIPCENKQNACDTPLCDTISKGYCAIWGGYLALGR